VSISNSDLVGSGSSIFYQDDRRDFGSWELVCRGTTYRFTYCGFVPALKGTTLEFLEDVRMQDAQRDMAREYLPVGFQTHMGPRYLGDAF
jgi:hypothetical protein